MHNSIQLQRIFLIISLMICTYPCMSDGVQPQKELINWGSPSIGAKISAGPKTEFLPPNDISRFIAGEGLIFRHGPRNLEKVLIVELPRPIIVKAVVVATSYEDIVRVPAGFDVHLSVDGSSNSWHRVASVNDIHADRTMAVVNYPKEVRFVRLYFRDSGGGSRVTDIGVYSDPPELVKERLGGFTYEPGKDWLSLDQIASLRKQYGSPKGCYITMICNGIEYSAPAPPVDGNLLSRFNKERGTVWRELQAYSYLLPYFSALGVKSMETYVRWNFVEDKPGIFDFSVYDAIVNMLRKNDLKWSPLLLAGPAYTLPSWFKPNRDYTPYKCLEHNQDNAIVSLWDPRMKTHVDRFFKAFVEHYGGPDSCIQSLMLGVTGVFGENLYPHESDKDWTTNATGDYHSHTGWWAGDKYAQQSFRSFMKARYKTISDLNSAWNENYSSFAELKPKLPKEMKNNHARYDFMDWYVSSMTNYTEFWLKTARKYMPKGDIQLCVGGDGRQQTGTDFTRSAKLAAKYNAGVRITNESPDYALNVAITRWMSTAVRTYKSWLGIEPASLQIAYDSIAQRVFNVRTSGARELFCYQSGLSNKKAYTKFLETVPFLKLDTPRISVAYWIPRTHMMATAGEVDYVGDMRNLRDAVDYDAVDDVLINDGVLSRYGILIMGAGYIEDERVLNRIEQWVENGGVIIRIRPEALETIDGSTVWQSKLFGKPVSAESASWNDAMKIGKGYTLYITDAYRSREIAASTVARLLANLGDLDGRIAPPRVMGTSMIYGSLMESQFMILNANPNHVVVSYDVPLADGNRMRGSIEMPDYSIKEIDLPR